MGDVLLHSLACAINHRNAEGLRVCFKGTVVESSARPRPRPRFCAAFKDENDDEEEEQSFIFKPSLGQNDALERGQLRERNAAFMPFQPPHDRQAPTTKQLPALKRHKCRAPAHQNASSSLSTAFPTVWLRLRKGMIAITRTLIILAAFPVSFAAEVETNSSPGYLLLTNSFGHSVKVATNEMSSSLHPPVGVGLERQIPTMPKGTSLSDEVRQRIAGRKSGRESWQWFPATPPVLMPYLGSLDEFGNTDLQPGAVFPNDPLSPAAQAGKYWLSGLGLRYSFYQSLTLQRMVDGRSYPGVVMWSSKQKRAAGKWLRSP